MADRIIVSRPDALAPRRPRSEHQFLLVLALLTISAVSAAQDLPEQRKQALVHLLRHDCGSCHGLNLRGGLGPALTAAALEQKSIDSLEATILRGRPGTPMPPWQDLLSITDVRWLVQVLKSGVLQ